ncbi:MAG: winged helix-turn-helix domain-containing protein [Pyrinomonadaceae bacterium]
MNTSKKELFYEFDGFRIEVGQRCLWHGNDLVPLTAKAFDTLLVLVENNGRLVEKDTLLSEVWASTFVEESTLAQNISTLRKAFAIQENGTQFIETIPRRGYRFLRDVHQFEEEDDAYVIETRTSTRVLAEKTEIHDTNPAVSRFFANRKLRIASISVICVTVLAGAFAAFRQFSAARPERFARVDVSSLSSSGYISKTVMSPDGKYVASIEHKNEMESLQLRQTSSSGTIELIPPSGDQFIGLTFSPGNESIYYSVYQKAHDQPPGVKMGVLYRVPSLGGPRTEVVKDIDSAAAVSPDGKKIAFIRYGAGRSEMILLENGMNERSVAVRPMGEHFATEGPSWSPDGKNIATVAFSKRDPIKHMEIVIIGADTGEQRFLTAEPWMWAGQTAWLKDGTGILFPAYSSDSPSITDDIWLANVSDGRARRITGGLNGILGISTNADSSAITAIRSNRASSLWVSAKEAPNTAKIINKSIGDNSLGTLGMDWTPDGKIVYSTATGGNVDIWIVDADGSNAKQLTDDPKADFSPTISPDGQYLVFLSNRSGLVSLMRMRLDGTNLKEIAILRDLSSPSVSPDGGWVYFTGSRGEDSPSTLWKVPSGGGEMIQLTDRTCLLPRISPDGKFVACFYPTRSAEGKFSRPFKPTILTSDGSQIVRQYADLDTGGEVPLSWTPDGTGFSFSLTTSGVSNIWIQKIGGGPPEKVTDFQTDEIFRYQWSRDGKTLAFEKGIKVNDVVLIQDTER